MSRPDNREEQIVIAHGGGGEKTRQLIAERFVPRLSNPLLTPLGDSAVIDLPRGRIAFTTDAHVVQPLEFPGGDIGRLSVCGTVNDLAVSGAIPKALSLAMVMEEGLSLSLLDRIIESIAAAAREAGVVIATGDTKVIERQRGDGMTITTAGVGEMRDGLGLDTKRINAGDAVLITGRIAEHGLAVMSAREGLGIQTDLRSDVAPMNGLIAAVLDSGADIKFMRDPTRGGLACVLADLAEDTGLSIEAQEAAIPLSATARHAAELLGLDPLSVANEGKVVMVTSEADAAKVVGVCKRHPLGQYAAIIGRMVTAQPPLVELVTRSGGRRLVQRPYGEELPGSADMHEASIAMAIVEQAEQAARPHNVTRITEIEIDVGAMKQIVHEALLVAFEACAAGTLAEGAVVKINEIPPAAVCEECGKEFTPDLAGLSFACPGCGKASATMVRGDEIVLKSMTCEQNDSPATAEAQPKES